MKVALPSARSATFALLKWHFMAAKAPLSQANTAQSRGVCAAETPFSMKIFAYMNKNYFLCIRFRREINIINTLKLENYVRNRIKSKSYHR